MYHYNLRLRNSIYYYFAGCLNAIIKIMDQDHTNIEKEDKKPISEAPVKEWRWDSEKMKGKKSPKYLLRSEEIPINGLQLLQLLQRLKG